MQFVLVQWTDDPGFSWSIVQGRDVLKIGEETIVPRAVVKAKWKSSKLPAKGLAFGGKYKNILYFDNYWSSNGYLL